MHLVATGELPQYEPFVKDAETIGAGVFANSEDHFRETLRAWAEHLLQRSEFKQKFGGLDDTHYISRLVSNAGLTIGASERAAMENDLKQKAVTRADVLLRIANDPLLREKEEDRSMVLIYFFAYLQRNPGDPPDRNMDGFNYWVREVKKHGANDLVKAFSSSLEFRARPQARKPK